MSTYTFENEGFSVKNEGFTHKICVCAHLIQILCMKDKNFRTIRKKMCAEKRLIMEVILLEDVRTLGKKGQIVKINDGYARNYVIPKKLGIEATPKNLNDLKLQKKREEKEAAEELAMAKELAATIEDKSVTVYMKTGEGGRTFGTISTKEVVAAVKEQLGLEVDKKKMKLDEPIKTLGTHIIALKLHKDVTAKLTVKVVEK